MSGNLMRSLFQGYFCFAFCIAIFCTGCGDSGPAVAPVEGVVTLDGNAVGGVAVQFYPVAGGRASIGYTNEKGYYQLVYSMHEAGAMVGQHEVTLFYDDDQESSGIKRVKIPKDFSEGSQTIKEVKRGKNVINLEMVSN